MPVNALLSPDTINNGLKVASGVHTTVAASDSIVTGLRQVLAVVASLQSDPVDDPSWVSAAPGTSGAITVKTWKNTSGSDPTPAAATTFSKVVNWIAVGY